MIQHPLAVDPLLRRLVEAIVSGTQPKRVILFGSRARGDAAADSDYDFVVELETTLERRAAATTVYAAIDEIGAPVDVLVRLPGELEQHGDDPGFVDWDVVREGVVLYDAAAPDHARLASGRPTRDRVRENVEPPSVRLWLERASRDLQIMDVLLGASPVLWDGVCFHAQQAAEKYLKAMLVRRMIRPPRTHDLTKLYAAVCVAGYEFPNVLAECGLLEPYAVDVRYPELVTIPDDVTGRKVVDAARRIVAAASGASD
jgi:HEPN domain-containing protein/predicted nucleotidyltransferase